MLECRGSTEEGLSPAGSPRHLAISVCTSGVFLTSCAVIWQDGMVDIRPKKCEVAGCKYAANYGDKVELTRRFCARHKLDGMFCYQDLVR